jgi:glycosyltransferase involved in cell wall biosynthesis
MTKQLAIITPRFWPLVGDGPTHLLRLAESLLAAGRQVTIVTARWKRAWPEQMTVGTVPLVRLRGSPRGGWSTLRWMYSLSRWLRDHAGEFDALLIAGLRHEAYVAIASAQRTHTPVLLMADENDLAWQQTASFGSRIASRCHEASAIVAPSREVAEQLLGAGYTRESVIAITRRVPIPPPRGPKSREHARSALAAANYDLVTTEASFVALAVGRLDADHRFGDLVRAWRIVTARRPEARLWIIGDGPERERLYRQISDLDQRFRALIPGTFDGLDDLLQAADLLLVPAPYAAPPLALLEAQAAGLPAITADAPALREHVLPHQTGLLFPSGDPKTLAAAVLHLIENPALAVALGSAARQQTQSAPSPETESADYTALLDGL